MKLLLLRHDEIAVACDHAKDHGLGEEFISQKIAEARARHPRAWAVLRLKGCCYLRYYYKKVVLGYFCQHLPHYIANVDSSRYSRKVTIFEEETMRHVLSFLGASKADLISYIGTSIYHRLKEFPYDQESPK